MTELFMVLMVVGTAWLILRPILFKGDKGSLGRSDKQRNIGELNIKKKVLLKEIKDIELDFEMGKISKEDFDNLTDGYRNQAIDVMKDLDAIRGKKVKTVEKTMTVPADQQAGFCTECGGDLFEGAKFCGTCGHES